MFDHSFGFYSVLKLFMGLATAAFITWKLTVTIAIIKTNKPAAPNIHHAISVRYAKSINQLFIIYQAIGTAMINATNINFKKSRDNIIARLLTVAPNTFRTPISFTF